MKITGVKSLSQTEAPSDPFSQLNIAMNQDESGLGPSSTESLWHAEPRQEGNNEEPFCVITSTSGADGNLEPDSGHETSPFHVEGMMDDCEEVDWSQSPTSLGEITAASLMSRRASSSSSYQGSDTTPVRFPYEITDEEPEEDPIPKDQDWEGFQVEPEGMVASDNPKTSGTGVDEIQKVVESNEDGQGHNVDDCQVMDEELPPGENSNQIPLYDVDTANVLTESVVRLKRNNKGKKVFAPKGSPRSKIGKRCFNCMGHHMLHNCPKPKRGERIKRNRELFRRLKGTPWEFHHHKDTKTLPVALLETTYSDLRLGHPSDSLRQALGLGDEDLPLYTYKMRKFGYPPGYLQLAKDILAHGLQLNKQNEVVPLSKLQELNGLLEKIPDYPGFTSVLPRGFYDEGKFHGIRYNPCQDTSERRGMKYWETQYSTEKTWNCVNRFISSLNGYLKKLEKITDVQGNQMQMLSSDRPVKIARRSHAQNYAARAQGPGRGRGHTSDLVWNQIPGQVTYKQTTYVTASKKTEWYDKAEVESPTQTLQTLRAFGVRTSVAASVVNVARNYHVTDKLEKQEQRLKERRRRAAAETVTSLNENEEMPSQRAPLPSMMDQGRSRKVARAEMPWREEARARKRRVSPSLFGDNDIDEHLDGYDQKADDDEDDDIMIIDDPLSANNPLGTDGNATKESSARTAVAGPPRKKVKVSVSNGTDEDDIRLNRSFGNSIFVRNPCYKRPNTSKTSDTSSHANLNSNKPVNAIVPRTKSSRTSSATSFSPGTGTTQEGGDAETWTSQAKKFSIPTNAGRLKPRRRVKSPSLLEGLDPIPSSQSDDEFDYFNSDSLPRNESSTCNNPSATIGSDVFATVEGGEAPLNVFQRDEESSQTVQGASTFPRLPQLGNFDMEMAEIPYEEQPRSGRLSRVLDYIQSRRENQPQDEEDDWSDTNGSSHTQQGVEESLIDLSSDDEVTVVAEVDPKANKNVPIYVISDSSN